MKQAAIPETDWEARTGRAFERDRITTEAGTRWLQAQGGKAGFQVLAEPEMTVTNYTQVAVERLASALWILAV